MSIFGSNLSPLPIAGEVTLAIDGQSYDVIGDAEYFCNTVKRETKKGQSGVHGFSEMPDVPYIAAKLRDNGAMTVQAFNAMRSVSVTLLLANGKIVSGDGMWHTEGGAVKTEEGEFDVRFEGFSVLETPV